MVSKPFPQRTDSIAIGWSFLLCLTGAFEHPTHKGIPMATKYTFLIALAVMTIQAPSLCAQLTITNPGTPAAKPEARRGNPSQPLSVEQVSHVLPSSMRSPISSESNISGTPQTGLGTSTDPLFDFQPASQTSPDALRQIRIRVRYLMVGMEERKQIYKSLGKDKLRHISNASRLTGEQDSLRSGMAVNTSVQRVVSPSSATTSVLDPTDLESVIHLAKQSNASEVQNAPSIFVLDGTEAEMNDLSQRPFVVDLVGQEKEPNIQVFDVGTRLRVHARIVPGESPQSPAGKIHLGAELNCSRIQNVITEQLFGLADEPVEVQVPQYMTKTVNVAEAVAAGYALLIDPHHRSTRQIQSNVPMPMVGRIPYLGQNFTSTESVNVEQYLLVILEPSEVSR
ncbi:Bacterial type II and III secretion system protein [Rubripirellula lacrimiformis]|uniref:Bacterial type II and III secretion system protein n=1 Tax=Rubripirellula lacrimiformis TaxID=1930273 RepID=A0A517NIM7_9BACT|nr:type II and III secretion system protein [Rubripirellula lacrimiformis]QDT06990.1 Bacterial type II and III secretion system protein [Rubripirellula lacrimiformis]